MNRTACGLIRSYLTQDIKYHVLHETSARQPWEILKKKYLTKSIESRLQLKRRFYLFQTKKGLSIDEHINNYTNLLTTLVNVDVKIEEEDKAVILLNSLPDKAYETFTLTLINVKVKVSYSSTGGEFKRITALSSSSTSTSTLTKSIRSFV